MLGLTRVNGKVRRMVALYTDLSQAPCEVLGLVPACHVRDHSQLGAPLSTLSRGRIVKLSLRPRHVVWRRY